MTLARFSLGIVLAFVAFAPLIYGSDAIRRAVLPRWKGVEGALVDAIVVLSAVVVVTQALGTFGGLSVVPVTLALLVTGLLEWLAAKWWRRRHPVTGPGAMTDSTDLPPILPTWALAASVGGMVLVVGSWLARTVQAAQHGMTTTDTLWYHLPIAARWIQTGRTSTVQYFDSDPVTAFFPANSSLFHAVGFLLFRTDLASAVINLGWLALALAAAWCVGRPFGVAPITAVGATLLLGTAGLVATQPGGAYDDIVGIALLLTAVAFALHRRDETRSTAHLVMIGLALGLCVGAKYTFVIPAVALALGLVVTTERGRRLRATIAILVAACVTGSYWYVRNAVVVGNPLPSLGLHLGPITLPHVKGAGPTSTVASFLFDGQAWRANFLPGLRSSLGPAWPVLVALAFAGMIGAIFDRREPVVRLLGIVAVVSFVGYLVTPQYLIAGFGRPYFFGVNVRYASPAMVLGLVLLPVAFRRRWKWVLGLLLATLVVTELDPTSWPTRFGWAVFADRIGDGDALWAVALLIVAAGLAAAGIWLWRRAARQESRPRRRALRWAVVAAVPLLVLLPLLVAHDEYLRNRYVGALPFPQVDAWVRDQHRVRIAVAGLFMQDQYPLVGADLSNLVQYAGIKTSGGGFRAPRSCDEWVRMLEEGHYEYVVIAPAPHLADWTATQPDSHVVLSQQLGAKPGATVQVFRLDPSRQNRSC